MAIMVWYTKNDLPFKKEGTMKVLIVIAVIVYILIGVVIDTVVREEWQSPSVMVWVFWPMFIGMIIIFGIINGAMIIGKKIRDILKRV